MTDTPKYKVGDIVIVNEPPPDCPYLRNEYTFPFKGKVATIYSDHYSQDSYNWYDKTNHREIGPAEGYQIYPIEGSGPDGYWYPDWVFQSPFLSSDEILTDYAID